MFLKPFGKIFNHFKKTLSRKNVNTENLEEKLEDDEHQLVNNNEKDLHLSHPDVNFRQNNLNPNHSNKTK